VQSVIPVNVAFEQKLEVGFRDQPEKADIVSESQMLTGDENIVNIDFVVMWKISDAGKFLFSIRDPEPTVKKVAESAMRETIGRTQIQKAMTEGRADIEAKTKDLMQKMLDEYQSGVVINSVQLLSVDPPAPVVDAFDDVQRARADMERTKNEAETYHNDIVPRARGEAQKTIQDAEAYKEKVISIAKGEAAGFTSVYEAYAQAKDVTAKRIYIETMEKIMHDSKKVVLGNDKGSTLLPYLSLDKLPQGGAKDAAASSAAPASTPAQ
jgi:membrane protease subunit HflK